MTLSAILLSLTLAQSSKPITELIGPPAVDPPADSMTDIGSIGPAEISGRGWVQNDFRVVVKPPAPPGQPNANGDAAGDFIRNQTQVMGRLQVNLGDKITAVVQARPVFTGIASVNGFTDLQDRTKLDPFWIEFDAAYVEVNNLFVRGLDLKLGRQTAVWGTSDLFNPTNNLNARDFYDPLLFGYPMANEMALVRYQTPVDLSFTAIYIPVFRPARLPPTAQAAFDRGATLANPADTKALANLQAFQNSFTQFPITNVNVLNPVTPSPNVANGMAAFKAQGRVLDIDFSASYLYGRWDLPVPAGATAVTTNTPDPNGGLFPLKSDNVTTIQLKYPRMHVIGADMSTSIAALGGMGLWAEGAVFFPERVDFTLNPPDLLKAFYPNIPCSAAKPCPVVKSDPFVKATVGVDYTFFNKIYANVQYLYGFVDEFGAGFMNHYLVATLDIKPFGDQYTLRLAGVLDLVDRSGVAFPAFVLKPYPGLEIYLGALAFLGTPTQKFGHPENGSTQVFCRARFSF